MENKEIHTFNVLDVISKYIPVKKAGGSYVSKCPFHSENDASLVISPQKNMWKCFGCGMGGDAVKFVSLKEGISYKDAYKKLCVEYGFYKEEYKKEKPYQNLYNLNSFINDAFVKTLNGTKTGLEIKKYLFDRGLTEEEIKTFEIGYSMLGKDINESIYKKMANEAKFLDSEIVSAGLLNSKGQDLYQNRITLPIKNEFGEVQGFVGRCVKDNLVRYLNTPETPIFKKSNVIFNLDKAVNEIRKLDEVIICEGSFDVIALWQANIKNAVCSLGTSLTINQLTKLKEFTNNICLLFDADSSGIKSTIKAYKLCKKLGLNFKTILLPEKEDPSSFLKKYGKDKLYNYVENNKVLFMDYYINNFFKKQRSEEKYFSFQKSLFELLSEENSLCQKLFLEKWAILNKMDSKLIKKDFIDFLNSKKSLKERLDYLYLELNSIFFKNKNIFLQNLKYLNKEFLPNYEKKFLNELHKFYKNNETTSYFNNNMYFNYINSFPKETRELKEVLKDIYILSIEEKV